MNVINFAGFTWPRMVATMPRGPLAVRLVSWKAHKKLHPHCGPYITRPRPIVKREPDPERFFYLASDFTPGLRWEWCDKVEGARINHRGWWSDDDGGGDKLRGVVLRLPHGRGFLAGWSMGEGMASSVSLYIWDNERDAARAADGDAEAQAERCREAAEEDRREEERHEAEQLLKQEHARMRVNLRALRTVGTLGADVLDALRHGIKRARADAVRAIESLRDLERTA